MSKGKPRPLGAHDLRTIADVLDNLPEPVLSGPRMYTAGLDWPGEYDLHSDLIGVAWNVDAEYWAAFVETVETEDW